MEIKPTDGVPRTGPVRDRRVSKTPPPKSVPAMPGADKLDISAEARLLSEVGNVPEVRMEKIREIRELIQSGKYETPEKLEAAIERFLREVLGESSY